MVALYVLGAVASLVALFFAWSSLHEVSHFLAVRRYRPHATAEFKLYPHRRDGRFYWASVRWTHSPPALDPGQRAWVSFAPRWADAAGTIAMPVLAWTLDGWAAWIPAFVALGGVVDLAVGSIGYNPESDLRRCARGWATSPWALRTGGWAAVAASAGVAAWGLLR